MLNRNEPDTARLGPSRQTRARTPGSRAHSGMPFTSRGVMTVLLFGAGVALAVGARAQPAAPPGQWLQLESQRQQNQLRFRQNQYLWQQYPLAPAPRREIRQRFQGQNREQQALQRRQQSEAARELQRRALTPALPVPVQPGPAPGRFAREQQQQQLRLDMQRRAWRY